jgi:hypothetical protein
VLETAAVCAKCKKASLRLKLNERRMGFVAGLVMECSNVFCGDGLARTGNEFFTSKRLGANLKAPFEVNRRTVLMGREIGCGHASLEVSTLLTELI